MLRRGFWVNLLNPKAIVFFLAFIPQFIRLDQPALPQYLILITTVVVVDVAVMWFFFAAAAKPFRRLKRTCPLMPCRSEKQPVHMVPFEVIVSEGNTVNVLLSQQPPSTKCRRMCGMCPIAAISCTTSGRNPST